MGPCLLVSASDPLRTISPALRSRPSENFLQNLIYLGQVSQRRLLPQCMEEAVTADYLREQAEKCVRIANSINDAEATAALRNMAMEYQIRAKRLDEAAAKGE